MNWIVIGGIIVFVALIVFYLAFQAIAINKNKSKDPSQDVLNNKKLKSIDIASRVALGAVFVNVVGKIFSQAAIRSSSIALFDSRSGLSCT